MAPSAVAEPNESLTVERALYVLLALIALAVRLVAIDLHPLTTVGGR